MRAYVAGVGMTPFTRIGGDTGYPGMVGEAVRAALADAGLGYGDVQRAAAGYVFQPSAAGQRALYDVGLTGIPVVNVNNNCATGSTALMLAREWVLSGVADVALAVGFEQMTRQALAGAPTGVSTIDAHLAALPADGRDVEIVAQRMVTDTAESFAGGSAIAVVGAPMTRRATAGALADAGVSIADVDVIELHDCFSINELITYEAIGLCPEGGGAELVWQLRGEAGDRQVPGARLALAHNLGLGGACVVTLYQGGKR